MVGQLTCLLEHLERTVDPDRQLRIEDLYRRTFAWKSMSRPPLILTYPYPRTAVFQPYPHRTAFDDPAKMLYNELVYAFGTSVLQHGTVGDDLPYSVRANFGTVIIASLFGATVEQVDDNPPWALPYPDYDRFTAVFDRDPTDHSQGLCPRMIERYDFYRSVLSGYPRVRQCVHLALPDLQGPLDTAELLRGSEIYLDFYQRPEMIARLLDILASAQIALARRLRRITEETDLGLSRQHATIIPGQILIREDSAINISAAMYREHVAPHTARVLRELGGGGVHCCGDITHLAEEFLRLPDSRAIDLGQPEHNNIDALYAKAQKRKVSLVRMIVTPTELRSGRAQARFPTGVVFKSGAASLTEAVNIAEAYCRD